MDVEEAHPRIIAMLLARLRHKRAGSPLRALSLIAFVALAFLVACTASPAPTVVPTATPVPPTATPTATPDPYAGLYIEDLRARSYGTTGQIDVVESLGDFGSFTRYLIRYPSDGLRINGFMNLPKGSGPFPVVIVIHGYVPPLTYTTVAYTRLYADPLASNGYLVLHPDLRGHGTSEGQPSPTTSRAAYAIDVLNLIALAKKLPQARTDAGVGVFGHSMGGGIAGQAMVASPDVKATVLYGAVSLDATRSDRFARPGTPTPMPTPLVTGLTERLSAINYLRYLSGPVSIHHGEADTEVSPQNSVRVAERLREEGRAYEYFTYPGQPHTFYGDGAALFIRRVVAFFDRNLKQRP